MKTIRKAILVATIGIGLGGCASPNIVIQPMLPAPTAAHPSANINAVRLVMDNTETNPQLNKYEEKSNKTIIGKSESLGVHLSDFWLEEPPSVFVQHLLEKNLKAWGHMAVTDNEQILLQVHLNKFSLESHAINIFQLQADGVIDVDLEVTKKNAPTHYKGHYVGICTYRTATEVPNKINMEKLFNQCVEEFQKQLESDLKLRTALSEN